MEADKVAMVLHIEDDRKNLNTLKGITEPRYYAHEAVRCVRSWRKNGGWLKDCRIYALCCTDNPPPRKIIDELKSMGVVYVEDKFRKSSEFSSGFLTIPYTMCYFEKIFPVKEDILFRIDLDNELLKPFPEKWFDTASSGEIVVGQYSEGFEERSMYPGTLPFDTSLVIASRKSHFLSHWYENCFREKILLSDEWQKVKAKTGDYWLEEFVVDWMSWNGWCVKPVKDYQYGPGYHDMEHFVKHNLLEGLYMKHSHITGADNTEEF